MAPFTGLFRGTSPLEGTGNLENAFPPIPLLQSRYTQSPEFGGTEDHVRPAVRVPATLPIGEWIGQMKGSSVHCINEWLPRFRLHVQQGKEAASFSEKAFDKIRQCTRNQKEHHTRGTMVAGVEQTRSNEEEAP